jgi:hypothetical protein
MTFVLLHCGQRSELRSTITWSRFLSSDTRSPSRRKVSARARTALAEELFLEGANMLRLVNFGHCSKLLVVSRTLRDPLMLGYWSRSAAGCILTPVRGLGIRVRELGVVYDVIVERLEVDVTHHALGDLTDRGTVVRAGLDTAKLIALGDPADASDSAHLVQEIQGLLELVTFDDDARLGSNLDRLLATHHGPGGRGADDDFLNETPNERH